MANLCIVSSNATDQEIAIRVVDAAGNLVAFASSIVLALDDISSDNFREAKFRLLKVNTRDPVSGVCTPQQAYFLMTALEPAT